MRSIAKALCLSLLAVALLAGSAQARTVNGCKIRPGTSCHHENLNGKDLRGANLSGANGCSTVTPAGTLNGLACSN